MGTSFFGISTPTDKMCAVMDCNEKGKVQWCPYDGRLHSHGMIHYDCGYPQHSVKFRTDRWRLICDKHFELVKNEREDWSKEKVRV